MGDSDRRRDDPIYMRDSCGSRTRTGVIVLATKAEHSVTIRVMEITRASLSTGWLPQVFVFLLCVVKTLTVGIRLSLLSFLVHTLVECAGFFRLSCGFVTQDCFVSCPPPDLGQIWPKQGDLFRFSRGIFPSSCEIFPSSSGIWGGETGEDNPHCSAIFMYSLLVMVGNTLSSGFGVISGILCDLNRGR
jgi:hypothetical protein